MSSKFTLFYSFLPEPCPLNHIRHEVAPPIPRRYGKGYGGIPGGTGGGGGYGWDLGGDSDSDLDLGLGWHTMALPMTLHIGRPCHMMHT